jgi:hypothetical protein
MTPVEHAWERLVTSQILPAFQAIKTQYERFDGTTVEIQRAAPGETAETVDDWVRLTWLVAPSASVLAALPPHLRSPVTPRTVLTYTITRAGQPGDTRVWAETAIPDSGTPRVFREEVGDYSRGDITKDRILQHFLSSYQRHVLSAGH